MERLLLLPALLALLASGCGGPKAPPEHLFGVRLAMPRAEVERILPAVGELDEEASGTAGAKQYWRLDDPHYGRLALRFDGEQRVKWMTAFARQEGRQVRYQDVGDLAQARLRGRYFYTWSVAPADDHEGFLVTARGSDPRVLSAVSLYTIGAR